MVQLPDNFTSDTRRLMGDDRFERYLHSFEEDTPVSIRLHPRKAAALQVADGQPVPWCRGGYYLTERPNFTFDPLLHAGCYYVQEASSMFLDEVLRKHLPESPAAALDLCAAPGGKSTLLRAALPDDCLLVSNEPVRTRASILSENVAKWGGPQHVVTNSYPRDFRRSGLTFDVILCDVPCSGEGMFRKDPATISEWSQQSVGRCSRLQRDIVADAWACLRPGGLFIYSTCTLNIIENEQNIRWMLDQFDDATVLPVSIRPEWNITGSLLDGFHEPVYRFIPGISRGEGLFMCVLSKRGEAPRKTKRNKTAAHGRLGAPQSLPKPLTVLASPRQELSATATQEIDYRQAMAYLRREAITLPPATPTGIVTVTFRGQPLGQVKNIGSRANNLYPKEWKIKTTHLPDSYTPILQDLSPTSIRL